MKGMLQRIDNAGLTALGSSAESASDLGGSQFSNLLDELPRLDSDSQKDAELRVELKRLFARLEELSGEKSAHGDLVSAVRAELERRLREGDPALTAQARSLVPDDPNNIEKLVSALMGSKSPDIGKKLTEMSRLKELLEELSKNKDKFDQFTKNQDEGKNDRKGIDPELLKSLLGKGSKPEDSSGAGSGSKGGGSPTGSGGGGPSGGGSESGKDSGETPRSRLGDREKRNNNLDNLLKGLSKGDKGSANADKKNDKDSEFSLPERKEKEPTANKEPKSAPESTWTDTKPSPASTGKMSREFKPRKSGNTPNAIEQPSNKAADFGAAGGAKGSVGGSAGGPLPSAVGNNGDPFGGIGRRLGLDNMERSRFGFTRNGQNDYTSGPGSMTDELAPATGEMAPIPKQEDLEKSYLFAASAPRQLGNTEDRGVFSQSLVGRVCGGVASKAVGVCDRWGKKFRKSDQKTAFDGGNI